MMQKKYNRALENRIDEVLYYIWYPIGVFKEPSARSEYTSYVLRVLQIVKESCDIETISKYLADIIRNDMGLSPDKKRCDITSEILLKYKATIQEDKI